MRSSDPLIAFSNVPHPFDRQRLQEFARNLRTAVTKGRAFHARITGDRVLRRLNRDFLGNDYVTDVLSFPSGSTSGQVPQETQTLGDIAISHQRAADQARRFGHTIEAELQILLLHGVLHLMGMDHETDRGAMARAETRWRGHFELPQGLIERADSASLGPKSAIVPDAITARLARPKPAGSRRSRT